MNNVGASVPPLRAGHREMKARVDCGYADPPCVSALLCRCSRAEHRSGARQWVKESNLRVSPGSHQKCGCGWSEYSRHPRCSSSSGAPFAPRRHRSAAAHRRNSYSSRDTMIRGRRAWLRFADRDSYAIGLASGASWVPRQNETKKRPRRIHVGTPDAFIAPSPVARKTLADSSLGNSFVNT